MKHKLKVLFELPGFYDSIRNYKKSLEEEKFVLSNIIQGELWEEKYFNPSKEIYPIILQADDFEPGNSLGPYSGSQKLCGVYVLLPFLPPYLVSKLQNILVTTIFYSKDRVFCRNEEVFKKDIEEFNQLSTEGLKFSINNKEHTVYFECVFIGGDNLRMNGICGFTESFTSKVQYWCRICRATGEQCGRLTQELKSILRKKNNYSSDFQSKTGGVKEKCCFHGLIKFHIVENKCLDIMHDWAEGTIHCTISKVLTKLVFVLKIISLSQLNNRIKNFDYADLERDNKLGILGTEVASSAEADILGTKTIIRMKLSAVQTLCLGRYIGLMIGDLIRDGNIYWKLNLILHKMIGIVTSPQITEVEIYDLENLITNHHELKIKLFGKLKPKDHLATHLPGLIRRNGPPIHFWSIPCEGKHTDLKEIAVNTSSKINVPLSIAIRDQINFCFRKETFIYESIDIKLGRKEVCNIPFF